MTTLYRSTDAGAPVQTGQSSSIIGVLTAVLVNGYGAQVGAGWTKPYVSGDDAVFRQGVFEGRNRSYLRIKEDFHAFSADKAVLTGYESMSSVSVGTNPFPPIADVGAFFSHSGGGVDYPGAVPWLCIADARTFIYYNQFRAGQALPDGDKVWNGMYFGDFVPYDPTEQFCQCLITGVPPGTLGAPGSRGNSSVGMTTTGGENYYAICRSAAGGSSIYTGSGSSRVTMTFDAAKISVPGRNIGLLPRPNPADKRVYLAPIMLGEKAEGSPATGLPRGILRGVYHWCHTYAGAVADETYAGTDILADRTFLNLKGGGNSNGNLVESVYPLEVSDTWNSR